MTERLLDIYRSATPDQRLRGRTWYPNMRLIVKRLARESGRSERKVAALMAVTSPRCQLVQNVDRTRRVLQGLPSGGFRQHDVAASRILTSRGDPVRLVTGPKTQPFARAILGEDDALVLDTWAFTAAGLPQSPTTAERRQCEAAYREAAQLAGETVRDFQAIVWTVARETMADQSGRMFRRQDVHHLL